MSLIVSKNVRMKGIDFKPEILHCGIITPHCIPLDGYTLEYVDKDNFTLTIYTCEGGWIVDNLEFIMKDGKLEGKKNPSGCPFPYYPLIWTHIRKPQKIPTRIKIEEDEVYDYYQKKITKSFILPEHHKYFDL